MYYDTLLRHLLGSARTVSKHLVIHFVAVAMLLMCWTAGPCIIYVLYMYMHNMSYRAYVAHQNFYALCVGWVY